MWGWLLIVALYVLGMGFFRWLGGISAASQALQRWGQVVGAAGNRSDSPSA
jgi:hypothetical protein